MRALTWHGANAAARGGARLVMRGVVALTWRGAVI